MSEHLDLADVLERLSPVTITTGSHNAEQLHPLSDLGKRYLQVGLSALWWQRSPRQQRESVLVESCRPGWNIIMPSSGGILLCRPRQEYYYAVPGRTVDTLVPHRWTKVTALMVVRRSWLDVAYTTRLPSAEKCSPLEAKLP